MILTEAQLKRLTKLEVDDPDAKIMGTLYDCPIVEHSGLRRPFEEQYRHLAYISPGGRLRGLGPEQERIYRRRKERG